MHKEKGFSLLEVSVAVAIMAILTTVGFTIASSVNEGNGAKSGSYEASAQNNLDNVECEIAVTSGTGSCGAGGGANPSDGVTAVWNGSVLSYSVNPALCNMTSQDVGYYYLNSGNGTTLMNANSVGSYIPSSYPLGGNLGFGVTIQSYYVMVSCDGVSTQSSNYVP